MRVPFFSRFSRTARIMCAAEGLIFIALLAAGYVIYYLAYPFEHPLPYSIGLLTGCAVSAAKILLLEKTNSRAVELGKHAKNYANLHAVLRYFGTVAAVAPAFIFRNVFGVFGVVAGLLSLQISAVAASVVIAKEKRKPSIKEESIL